MADIPPALLKTFKTADRANQYYLGVILKNTNTPIFLKTTEFKYILVNREFERLAQFPFKQIVGKDDFAIFPRTTAKLFRSQDEEVVKQKKALAFEETITLHNGVHTLIAIKFPLFDHHGKVEAVGGISTDITARKKERIELKEIEQKYSSVFDYSALGIMLFDNKGIITVCNEKLAEILHTKAKKIKDFNILKYVTDKNVKNAAMRVLSGQIAHHEGTYTSITSGKSAYLRGVFLPMFSDEGTVSSAVCVVEDLTQQKETEEALHKTHDELEQRVAERTEELNQKTKRLIETNIALEILLEKREADRNELEEQIRQNIDKLIRPYLEKLQLSQSEISRTAMLRIINKNLDEITFSFAREKDYFSVLTPAQLRVADLIKHGHTTKEIAHLLNLSPSTIACHRQEIRKRLSLTNKKINLQSVLTINS